MIPSYKPVDDTNANGDEWDQYQETDNSANSTNNDDDESQQYSSQDLRQMANNSFAQADYDSALPLYTMALEALIKEQQQQAKQEDDETTALEVMVTFLCNRAACLFKMELYEDARTDSLQAVEISQGKNAKASFRLAKTQMALGDYPTAISTLENAIAKIPETTTTNNNNQEEEKNNNLYRNELHKLLLAARTTHLQQKHKFTNTNQASLLAQAKSLRTEPNRKPSIREFDIDKTLGEGNFSRVVSCTHSVTKEVFALKIIEKKKAKSLAKQQHPNVYNEIEMEKRILSDRLHCSVDNDDGSEKEVKDKSGGDRWDGYCRRIIKLYHCFQDYNSLYFLMDLHSNRGDLWRALRYRNQMVGAHPSLAKIYLYELLEALEFLHSRGIVHRDLKAENIILSNTGHVILIDFGTAKDLVKTDLNGPEFVGTADFMAPEAVVGTSGSKEVEDAKKKAKGRTFGSDHTLDLWEFGAVIYQVLTGVTPFSAPSPFLQFLKIQRGNLYRPIAIPDDDAWDLIQKLLRLDPEKRLGADCFEVVLGEGEGEGKGMNKIVRKSGGYDIICQHPYFASIYNDEMKKANKDDNEEELPIPSLRDLCIRACAQLVENDSLDLDIDKVHPPGDNSAHDMLRLNPKDRQAVMALLEKLRLLNGPRVYNRFFKSKQEARLTKVRENTRDYVGLTQMIDKQHRFPTPSDDGGENDVSDVLLTLNPITFKHISNPLFVKEINLSCTDEGQRKQYITQLKESLKAVNKARPKLVIASGYLDDECKKLLGKVNETIPVVLNDGSTYYSFWSSGAQGLVLRSSDFIGTEKNRGARSEQMIWLREQLEQSRTTQHHVFVFVDCDVNILPRFLLNVFAKGRVLCLFGVVEGPAVQSEKEWQPSPPKKQIEEVTDETNDSDSVCSALSVSSDESDAEVESQTMKILQRGDATIKTLTIEEYGQWKLS